MSCVVKLRELGRYSRKRMSLIGWQLLKLLMGIWSNWCCFQHSNWIGFFGRWFEDIYIYMKSISIKNYRTWIERIGPQPHRAVFFQIVDISDYVWFGRCHIKSTTHITHHIITFRKICCQECAWGVQALDFFGRDTNSLPPTNAAAESPNHSMRLLTEIR